MAGIDKIYGTAKEWDQFYTWCKRTAKRKKIHHYFYPRPRNNDDLYPLTNLRQKDDMWLLSNCPFKWVTDRIKDQYNLR